MKRFLAICLTLIVSSSLTIFYLYQVEKPFDYRESYFKKAKNKQYDLIILGTSHAWAIDKNISNLKSDFFNKNGNSLYYDLQNYYYLKNSLNDSALIILPVSYFSFGVDENRTDQGGNNSFVNDYYRYLEKDSIYNYNREKVVQLKLDRIRTNFFKHFEKKKAKTTTIPTTADKIEKKEHSTEKLDSLKKSSIETPLETKEATAYQIKYIKLHGKERYEEHTGLISYVKDPSKNIEYLSRLIEDAKESGFRPILFTAPFHHEFNKRFDEDLLNDKFYQHIHELSELYNVPYLNYASGNSINKDFSLYSDSDHLNEKGIAIFNTQFQEDLRALQLID